MRDRSFDASYNLADDVLALFERAGRIRLWSAPRVRADYRFADARRTRRSLEYRR